MADLQMNAMRDTLRGLRSDVEGLRRRAPSGTMLEAVVGMGTAVGDGIYVLDANNAIRYSRLGDLVVTVPSFIRISSITAAGTGGLYFLLPVAPRTQTGGPIGRAKIRDASTGTETMVDVEASGSYGLMYVTPAAPVTPTSPFTWAAPDSIYIGSLTYEAET